MRPDLKDPSLALYKFSKISLWLTDGFDFNLNIRVIMIGKPDLSCSFAQFLNITSLWDTDLTSEIPINY